MKPVFIAFVLIIFLLSLQFILPQRVFDSWSDNELRQEALEHGLSSNPNTFNKLLKIQNTKDNPLTKEKIILGRELYFDNILSKNSNISCNSCHTIKASNKKILLNVATKKDKKATNCFACHAMDNSGTDRMTFSVGANENPHKLNAQTILNSSLAKYFTWDGNIKTLQEQISDSITSPFKMNMEAKEVERRLKKVPHYVSQFREVFNEEINFKNITKAIEAYIKTLLTRGSYDRFLDGDNNAISKEAKRGFALFINLGCKGCHTGRSVGGQSLQRFPLRRCASIYDIKCLTNNDEFPFEDLGDFFGKNDMKIFRVPILRNITKTSPYFHNGAVFKIRRAVDIMARHQLGKELSATQIDEIVEFLKTLEGEIVNYGIDNEKK